jgi:hypothetical protein
MRLLVLPLVAGLLAGCGQSSQTPRDVPQSGPLPAPAARSDKELVLDAILRDVLESDFLKDVRASYGSPGDRRVALVSNASHGIPWPEDYRPVAPEGYEVRRVAEGAAGAKDQPRMLGIRIDKLEVGQREAGLFREPIEVTVMNAGGRKKGDIVGGCSVYYVPARKGNGWAVEATRFQGQ